MDSCYVFFLQSDLVRVWRAARALSCGLDLVDPIEV
jgi:hypothetical protein